VNDGLILQSKELSGQNNKNQENYINLEDEIKKIQSEKYNLEDDFNIIKGKYEFETKETRKLDDKNKELNHKVKQLLSYLKTYHLEAKEFKIQNWNLIDKLNFYYDQSPQYLDPNLLQTQNFDEQNLNNVRIERIE
jgi:predicted nuclease with TOPRIM domain